MKNTGSTIFNPAYCPENWSGTETIQIFWTVEHCPTTGTVANIENLEHVSCAGKEAIAETCFLEYYGKSAKAIIENQIKTAAKKQLLETVKNIPENVRKLLLKK